MKSTLIFLSFFLLFFTEVSANMDTVYTQENGLVKMTIQDIKPEVLKEQSFQNTTEFQFSSEEVAKLFSGQTIIKDSKLIMVSFFPPKFSESWQEVSLVNGVTTSKLEITPEEFSLRFLFLGIILPFIFILFISLQKKVKTRNIILSYISVLTATGATFVITAISAIAAVIAVDYAVAAAAIMASIAIIVSVSADVFAGAIAFLSIITIILTVAGVAFVSAVDKTLGNQYIVFIVLSCIVSFILRQWQFKKKERKELTQTTV